MKLTKVNNLVAIEFDIWYIDSAGNIVLELSSSFNSSLYLIYYSSKNQFQTVGRSEAVDVLRPPFYPINIKKIFFEMIR